MTLFFLGATRASHLISKSNIPKESYSEPQVLSGYRFCSKPNYFKKSNGTFDVVLGTMVQWLLVFEQNPTIFKYLMGTFDAVLGTIL
jgi:hypothetical protein